MKRIYLLILVCVLFLAGCSGNNSKRTSSVDLSKPYLEVELSFNTSSYAGTIFGKYFPSFSIWIEDEDGNSVKTLYATKKVAANKWSGSSDRPSALPIWYGVLSKEFVGRENEKVTELDAISGATSSKETAQIKCQIPEEFVGKKVNVYLEANLSFDYNDHYKKDLKEGDEGFSDVNGQPSILWKAQIDTDKASDAIIVPEIVGSGEVLGKDHEIYTDTSNVTTAKQIFTKIEYGLKGLSN